MPTIPPAGKSKRVPPKRAPENVRDKPTDTPNPPTAPVEVPETPVAVAVKAPPKPRAGSLERRLQEAFASLSVLPSFAGDQYSSYILASRSEKFATDLAELAKVNKRVHSFLTNLLDGGAYGGIAFSGAAMLLPIAWAYGILPAPPVDIFAPFYPPVPAGIVPRSAVARRSSAGSRAATPPGSESVPNREGAPVGDPPGVVVIKPSMVPPINPAAL